MSAPNSFSLLVLHSFQPQENINGQFGIGSRSVFSDLNLQRGNSIHRVLRLLRFLNAKTPGQHGAF